MMQQGDRVQQLYKDVCAQVLRYGFKGLPQACRGTDPHEMLRFWCDNVPGFREYLDEQPQAAYPRRRWTPNTCLLEPDQIAAASLFHYTRFTENHDDLAQHNDKFRALLTLAVMCHSKELALPQSCNADAYRIWPAFVAEYPASAAALAGKRTAEHVADGQTKTRAKRAKCATTTASEDCLADLLRGIDARLATIQEALGCCGER